MSYHTIKAQADKIFEGKLEMFLPEIEQRIKNRLDQPLNDLERKIMVEGEFRSIQSEYIAEHLHEERVEQFKEFFDLHNSSGNAEIVKAMLEALQKTHRHIQSEALTNIVKLMEGISKAMHFDGRNQHWQQITERLVWAYNHPNEVEALMKKI